MKTYTTEEVAKKFGYADSSVVRALIKSRGLEFQRKGKGWVIPEKDLDKLERKYKRRRRRKG
jgi:excisionase family DNA binding protein